MAGCIVDDVSPQATNDHCTFFTVSWSYLTSEKLQSTRYLGFFVTSSYAPNMSFQQEQVYGQKQHQLSIKKLLPLANLGGQEHGLMN
jgi:hypothetical protein